MLNETLGMPLGGSTIDFILAGIGLEAVVLLALRRFTGSGTAGGALAANLVAGASLLFALRLALAADGTVAWIPICLLVALVAHAVDLAMRWERNARGEASRPNRS